MRLMTSQRAGRLLAAVLTAAVVPLAAPATSLTPAAAATGEVTTDFGSPLDYGYAVATGGGRIVVGGTISGPKDFALARYTATGALDPTFGAGGRVTTDLGLLWATVEAVAVLADGRVLAAGHRSDFSTFGGKMDVVLVRYRADGSLDPAFGAGGIVITDFADSPTAPDWATDLAVQPDGRIVVVGNSGGGFAAARFRPDGSLDPAFGAGGKVRTSFNGAGDDARSVVIQPDGRIVVGGSARVRRPDGSFRHHFALLRYTMDGALDPDFGAGGKVITDFAGGGFDTIHDLALAGDGRIVAVGQVSGPVGQPGSSSDDVAVARYRADGTLDPGFGTGGTVRSDFGDVREIAHGVVVRPDGRIVVAGYTETPRDFPWPDFLLLGYRSDGGLDPAFGQGGRVTTDFRGGLDYGYAAVQQDDGRVIVAGAATTDEDDNSDFALARYTATGAPDTSFG